MPDLPELRDPQVLRAIAHPLRNRILNELSAQGSLRAADIARDLAIPANQASFHLRQLAKYGLVEEDPDAGRDRRDRVWRVTQPQGYAVHTGDLERSPETAAAAGVFRAHRQAWTHQVVDRAFGDREPEEHGSVSESALRLTKAEAEELADEVNALVDGWAERHRGRDESRRTYLWLGILLPHPDPGSAGTEPGTDA